jgi:hypothetical protein
MKTQLTDLNPTTRCFPRSRMEAYPIDYMSGIEHYKRPSNKNYVFAILLIVGTIVVSIAMKVI